MTDDPTRIPATEEPRPSRRQFVAGGAVVLASVALMRPDQARAATAADATTAPGEPENLALYRPVTVSSTDYGPVQPRFAVDRMNRANVFGSGWRAAPAAAGAAATPQWIAVDLQARCRVESLRLVFETARGDTVYAPTVDEVNPHNGTTGWEVLSSFATQFRIDSSTDGETWSPIHYGATSAGGVIEIALQRPVTTRWLRLTGTANSNRWPLGLNSFEVLGTARGKRPAATGWTDWTSGADPVPTLAVADDGTVPLDAGWNLTTQDLAGTSDGAALSAPGVDTGDWLRATVPGTILASLVEKGHLPDPVRGLDNQQVPEALSRNSWWYRRELALPAGFPTAGRTHLWLELDGINHAAEIWVDGTKAGAMAHPSARAAIDIAPLLAASASASSHVVAVRIDPMPVPGTPGEKDASGSSYADAGANQMMLNGPTWLAVSGWDWMPAVRDRAMGIWNHVRLRSTGDAVLGDPHVSTVLPDPDRSSAEVTLTVPVRNAGAAPISVAVRATLGEVAVSRTVTVAAGAVTDAVFAPSEFPALRIAKPELWWPNGYGAPTLHEVTTTATVGGVESDRRIRRVGLRSVAYESENPIVFPPGADRVSQTVSFDETTARYVRMTGGRRATGFGVSLWTFSVRDQASPDTDLARAATATSSSVDSPDRPASLAIDGDPATRWSSSAADGQWIQLDLGDAKPFDTVELVWERAYALDAEIEVSDDGATWSSVATVKNAPHQLRILVNGVPIMVRGGNWGWDEFLRRMDGGRMEAVVGMHRDMNFTMIRNWLGISNREEFFEQCDANGLLVWNDFWNAWFLDPPDHAVYLDQVRDTILRYRAHPSIVVWCGANEGTPSGEIDQGSREAVAALTPDVAYLSNSASGIVGGSGPYSWVDPARYFEAGTYANGTFGFHTEIGIPTVSTAESMKNLAGDQPAWPIGLVWNYHDWATKGGQNPQSYQAAIDERLGASSSLEEFAERAQFVNLESLRAMFEAWNANLWNDATGLLLWMSNPAWHSTVWQTYDYDLDVNGSYYGSRIGSEPLHVQADPRDWSVLAVNHTSAGLKGATVTAEVLGTDGRALVAPIRTAIDLAAASSSDAGITVPRGAPAGLQLVRLTLRDAKGTVRSQNVYWRTQAPTDLKALNSLTRARLKAVVGDRVVRNGRTELSVRVQNTGRDVSPMTRISLRDRKSGARVLPTLYSDNYLWLMPGEERWVTVSCPGERGGLTVTAKGYRTGEVRANG